jgi:hypothetical protein
MMLMREGTTILCSGSGLQVTLCLALLETGMLPPDDCILDTRTIRAGIIYVWDLLGVVIGSFHAVNRGANLRLRKPIESANLSCSAHQEPSTRISLATLAGAMRSYTVYLS